MSIIPAADVDLHKFAGPPAPISFCSSSFSEGRELNCSVRIVDTFREHISMVWACFGKVAMAELPVPGAIFFRPVSKKSTVSTHLISSSRSMLPINCTSVR